MKDNLCLLTLTVLALTLASGCKPVDEKTSETDTRQQMNRTERSGTDAKAAANPRLNELRNQAKILESRINEVKDATASTWNTVKANTRETYDNLVHNFDDARQWMSDKIAP